MVSKVADTRTERPQMTDRSIIHPNLTTIAMAASVTYDALIERANALFQNGGYSAVYLAQLDFYLRNQAHDARSIGLDAYATILDAVANAVDAWSVQAVGTPDPVWPLA